MKYLGRNISKGYKAFKNANHCSEKLRTWINEERYNVRGSEDSVLLSAISAIKLLSCYQTDQ